MDVLWVVIIENLCKLKIICNIIQTIPMNNDVINLTYDWYHIYYYISKVFFICKNKKLVFIYCNLKL